MTYDPTLVRWLEDPVAEREALSSIELSRATAQRLLSMATPEAAADIATTAFLHPTISPELATSAFVAGIPAEDDYLGEVAALEQEQTRTIGGIGGFFGRAGDILRGITRWTALAFNGLYDEVINRPLRTAVNLGQGMDLGDAYANSGNAPFAGFGEAISAAFDPTTHVNLGTGWLPRSEVAAPVNEALAELAEDVSFISGRRAKEGFWSSLAGTTEERATSPDQVASIYEKYRERYGYQAPTFLTPAQQAMMLQSQINERIMEDASNPSTELGMAQSRYGRPVVQRQMAEADSVIMNLKGAPWVKDNNYSQVSVGRVFGSLVTESGTQPYHWLTGGIDFLANIFMDPANAIGGGIAKVRKGARALGVGEKTEDVLEGIVGAAKAAGVSDLSKAGKRIDELGNLIEEAAEHPAYRRYQEWSPRYRAKADELADMGVQPTKRLETYRQAGLVAREVRQAEEELAHLAANPDLVKAGNYADATKARILELVTKEDGTIGRLNKRQLAKLEAKNPKLAAMYRTWERAENIQGSVDDLTARIGQLSQLEEYKKFNRWKPSTREKALELAEKATLDPATASAKAVEQQRVAREALRTANEIAGYTHQIDLLENVATFEYQVRKAAGLVDGPRKTVDPIRVSDFITGPTAQKWVDAFVEADLAGVDDLLGKVNGVIPRAVRAQLADATTREEVISALLPHLGVIKETGMGLRTRLGITNPVARMHRAVQDRAIEAVRAAGMDTPPKHVWSRIQRTFGQMSPGHMDLNDLDRSYELLVRHAENIGWTRGDEQLEAILRRFTTLEDGDFDHAFDILHDYRLRSIERLTSQGLTPEVSKAVTDFIGYDKAASRYFQDSVGNVVYDGRIMIAGAVAKTIPPHLISEMFKGVVHMPSPRLIRHAAAELDALGQFMNKIATRGAKELFDQRWAIRATNNIMTKYWKPAVLLRLAWPIRVIGEEQARMAAAGISQPMRHPIQMIARIVNSKKNLDVVGDALSHADDFAMASARRVHFQGDYQSWGLQFWEPLDRNLVSKVIYRDGLLAELNQLWSDPIVHRLFETINPGELAGVQRIDETVDWLLNGPGQSLLNKLRQNTDDLTRQSLESADGVRMYLESVVARAHQKAGGNWRLLTPDIDANGVRVGTRWQDARGQTGVLSANDVHPPRATYQIIEPGIDELVESYGTKTWRDINVAERMAEDASVLASNPKITDIHKVRKELDSLINSEAGQRLPQVVKGTKKSLSADANKFDEIVTHLFDILMSRPTNRLSRHPAFKEFYWRHLGEMAPFMDEATLAAARAGAKAAGDLEAFTAIGRNLTKGGALREFEDAFEAAAKASKGAAPSKLGLLNDLTEADQAAKAMSLTSVQDLLFDVSKRANISDAMSIIAPFADAWMEVIGTWLRIMKSENIRPFRRFQQAVESGRESNPFDPASGYSNQGFFYKDGDREVFTVPAINNIWNKLAGTDAEWEYSLQGLSIATSVLPAVGPVVQTAINPIIPDNSEWDWLREYISPFGSSSIQRGLTPSSWQRFIAAFDFTRNTFADQSLQYLYDGAVMDALAWMERNDPEFETKWRANKEATLDEARGKATQLFVVQGLARFAGPAAPSTRPTAEDAHGVVWQTAMLSDEYYKLLNKNEGDELAARNEFINLFGLEPITFITPKSVEILPTSETGPGYNFKRANPELFSQYPTIAYYLGPAHLEEYTEFSWDAYYDSLVEGTRERLNPEQWQRLLNDGKGRLAYKEAVAGYERVYGLKWGAAGWDTNLRRQVANDLRAYDQQLMHQFPGYTGAQFGSDVEGLPAKVDVDRQITELREVIVEHPEMLQANEDGEPTNPAVYAARAYLAERDLAFQLSASIEGQPLSSGQDDPDSPHFQARQYLRQYAAQLIAQYPEFGPMWEGIFAREMYNDFDDEMTIEDAYQIIYGSGEETDNG